MNHEKKSLTESEWILTLSLLAILGSLVLLAKINASRATILVEAEKLEPVEKIAVTVEGAVSKPGTYQIIPGTQLSQVLKKAHPKKLADLTSLDPDERMTRSICILIEECKEISVRIQGAVEEPLDLSLPPNTRLCDLKSKIPFASNADPEFIKSLSRKRRRLKNKEILEIPEEKVLGTCPQKASF